jgi:iron complex transport system substrate-binding protein
MTPHRIVSLLPSATEIVSALGFGPQLIGRSHECDYPPDVEKLPVCTSPKVDVSGSSDEIHRGVEQLVRENISVYRVDAELLRRLAPTHVVTQVQCEVCAVSLDDVRDALADWSGQRPNLVALSSRDLADVLGDIQRVADSLGAPERGRRLVASMSKRMSSVSRRAQGGSVRPRVATIEWLSPLMAAGNWMPQFVEMAGGENLFGQNGVHSSWLDWEDLRCSDPDVILLLPCGFSLERVRQEIGLVTSLPGWESLSAVREGRVFLAEGNQLFNRPGPRLVQTLEAMAEMIHPELFPARQEGVAWQRLSSWVPTAVTMKT